MDHASEALTEQWPKAVVANDSDGQIASVTLVHSSDEAEQLLTKLLEGHLLNDYVRTQFFAGVCVFPNFCSGDVRLVDLTPAQDVRSVYVIDQDEAWDDDDDADWEDDEDDE